MNLHFTEFKSSPRCFWGPMFQHYTPVGLLVSTSPFSAIRCKLRLSLQKNDFILEKVLRSIAIPSLFLYHNQVVPELENCQTRTSSWSEKTDFCDMTIICMIISHRSIKFFGNLRNLWKQVIKKRIAKSGLNKLIYSQKVDRKYINGWQQSAIYQRIFMNYIK